MRFLAQPTKRFFFIIIYWWSVLTLLMSVTMAMRSHFIHDSWDALYVRDSDSTGVGSSWRLRADSGSGELMLFTDAEGFGYTKRNWTSGFHFFHWSLNVALVKASNMEFRAGLFPPASQMFVRRLFGAYANFPYWILGMPGVIFITWNHFKKQRSRSLIGHCEKCGYDLRGTPERCPECGNIT